MSKGSKRRPWDRQSVVPRYQVLRREDMDVVNIVLKKSIIDTVIRVRWRYHGSP